MFCKIRKNKNCYAIYLCDRKRISGEVVSKDKKIITFAWHSLYEIEEEYNGLIEDIPDTLYNFLTRLILRNYDLNVFEDVVKKLIKAKVDYYPTYKPMAMKSDEKFKEECKSRENIKLQEYEKFKLNYQSLYYKDLSEKYQEGYLIGQLSQMSEANLKGSGRNTNVNDEEKKLLKKIYKKMAMEFHPDRNLDNQEGAQKMMVLINKLKEEWNI